MNGNTEIWESIPGYEGIYEVSTYGRVRSVPCEHFSGTRIFRRKEYLYRKFTTNSWGYYVVGLRKDNKEKKFLVHQLVAITFLGHIICGLNAVIDHIDRDKLNNNVNNLRIVTVRENNSNKSKDGHSSKYIGVYKNALGKWSTGITLNGKNYNLFSRASTEEEAKNIFEKAYENIENFDGNISNFKELIGVVPKKYSPYYDKNRCKFTSEITINRVSIFLKRFSSKEEAIKMNEIARSVRGEFKGDKEEFRNKVKKLYEEQN